MTAAAHADITISAWRTRVTRTIIPGCPDGISFAATGPALIEEKPMVVRAVIAALLVVVSVTALARERRDLSAAATEGTPLRRSGRQGAKAEAAAAQTGTRAARKSASIAGRVIQADGAAAEGARIAVYAVREGAPAAVVG